MFDRSMEINAQAYRERQLEKASRSRLVRLAQGQQVKGCRGAKASKSSASLHSFGRLIRAG